MKVVVFGASGMLGHAMVAVLSENSELDVIGTIRSQLSISRLRSDLRNRCQTVLDVDDQDQLVQLFVKHRPDVVINCIGLIKQLAHANDPLSVLPVNAMLPHRLAHMCKLAGARLIHISTDCVFSGRKGAYVEEDESDATDLYGKSKYIGEVIYPHCITLRTSIIGHELSGKHALVEWFLSQERCVRGFTRAIFSGLPTVELARVVRDYVLANVSLNGLFHVASKPINKFDLLTQIANVYGKEIMIERDSELAIDRSLNGHRFEQATGYLAPPWPELLTRMHAFQMGKCYV